MGTVENIDTIRYDTVEGFSVESKAECGQLNLARVVRKKYKRRN